LGDTPDKNVQEAILYLRTPQEKAEEKYAILLKNLSFHTTVIRLNEIQL